ncbi:hypothetical protein IFM89_009764 [Coptis chinensis]|uniref:Uncharacterized protein n=1 Tax=Coptis chinensis TaxID=261450 RepID=A0A835I3E9_9MAGN|nr:hypothetical protein IFM89_009764 [Coptis chinensis]
MRFCLLVFVSLTLTMLFCKNRGDSLITGTVFCDQCGDGVISNAYDYPLYGTQVKITCTSSNRVYTVVKEETTDWFGRYTVRFGLNLTDCVVVFSSEGNSFCGKGAGPGQQVAWLVSTVNCTDIYTVSTLLRQPAESMPFCSRWNPSSRPAQTHEGQVIPPSTAPTFTFPDVSASPPEVWASPEYGCHWKMVRPNTTVASIFGENAARKYGTFMNLLEGLQGVGVAGDSYRTLLREGIAALLNSYSKTNFIYPPLYVLDGMNRALLGTPDQALLMALWFSDANTAYGSPYGRMVAPCNA